MFWIVNGITVSDSLVVSRRTIAHASPTFEKRFWAKVQKTDTCWLWTATKTPSGYGSLLLCSGVGWKMDIYAHRASWEMHNGRPVPDDFDVDHLCRNTSCVNPDHLEAVPHAVNIIRGQLCNRLKTHCKNGHEFTPENTYTLPSKVGRFCRTCERARAQVRRRARKPNPVRAECHPDRPHLSRGLCSACYQRARIASKKASAQ